MSVLNLSKRGMTISDTDKFVIDEILEYDVDDNEDVVAFKKGALCLTVKSYNPDTIILDAGDEYNVFENALEEQGYKVVRV